MQKFKSFIEEEVDTTQYVGQGSLDIHSDALRDNINTFLVGATADNVLTPYIALEKVNKVLANFHIFLPKTPFLEGDRGVHVFSINQFGRVSGQRDNGEIVTRVDQPYNLYFEWQQNDHGMFKIFCEIVTDEELEDLIDDVEADVSSDTDDRDEKLDEQSHPMLTNPVEKFSTKRAPINPNSLKTKPVDTFKTKKDPKSFLTPLEESPNPDAKKAERDATAAALAKWRKKNKMTVLDAGIPDGAGIKKKNLVKKHLVGAKKPKKIAEGKVIKALKKKLKSVSDTAKSLLGPGDHKYGNDPYDSDLKEAVNKKVLKKSAEKQRKIYVKKKGDLPPIMTTGKGRYTFTDTPEKKKLTDILKKAKDYRSQAKAITKEKRQEPKAPPAAPVSAPKPVPAVQHKADLRPQSHDFDSHLDQYAMTKDPKHRDAAKRLADIELARELARITSSGARRHTDETWARNRHRQKMKSLAVLDPAPEKKGGFMSKIKKLLNPNLSEAKVVKPKPLEMKTSNARVLQQQLASTKTKLAVLQKKLKAKELESAPNYEKEEQTHQFGAQSDITVRPSGVVINKTR